MFWLGEEDTMEPQGRAWSGVCCPRPFSTSTVPSPKGMKAQSLGIRFLALPALEAGQEQPKGWAGGQAAGMV